MNQSQKVVEMRNAEYRMIISGKDATPAERKRILGARAQRPEKSRATAPLERKPFNLLK